MNDPTPDPLRYEVKYVARASELPRLLAWVKNTQACFTEPYPTRQVNNIYFDTFATQYFCIYKFIRIVLSVITNQFIHF